MRSVFAAFAVAVLSSLPERANAQVTQQGVTLPASVAAARDRDVAAWLKGDAVAAGALFTPDAIFQPIGFMTWSGREAIEKGMASFFQRYKNSAVRFEPQEFTALGPDHAIELGRLYVTRRQASDSVDRAGAFRYSYLWKRSGGAWLIHRAMNNVEPAPAAQRP